MNLKNYLIPSMLLAAYSSHAQDYNGFRTDNYAGTSSAFYNPASLSSSPYKVDVNLFGMNLYVGNNNMNLGFKSLSEIQGDSNALNTFVNNGKTSIAIAANFHLPSFSFRVNDKLNIGFLWRSRVLFSLIDFDGGIIQSINNEINKNSLPLNINSGNNMRLTTNLFSDMGLTGSYNVYKSGNHYLSVGATLKFLAGVGNAYGNLSSINAKIDTTSNGKVVATNASGSMEYGVGGMDVNNPSFKLAVNSVGFGADLGVMYEYRPEDLAEERFPYLFKINAAILDIGSIKYDYVSTASNSYGIHIPNGTYFDMEKLNGDSYKDTFNKYPAFFTQAPLSGSYKVSLPRTLQLGGDFRAVKNIYVAVNAQIRMVNNDTKAYNPFVYNAYTFTPRFESKWVAAYLPINISSFTGTTLGFGLRLGPLYAGSSSILSSWMNNSKQIDCYFGLRFGIKGKSERDAEK